MIKTVSINHPVQHRHGPVPIGAHTTLPPAWAPLAAALRQHRPVAVAYHGRQRIICPHALGWKNQKAMVLGYQVGGQTSTGGLDPDPRKRWRCLYIDEIQLVVDDQHATWHTPDNYHPEHPFKAIDELAIATSADTVNDPRPTQRT
jgi:hypothetical protein